MLRKYILFFNVILVAIICILVMSLYLKNSLAGNINLHFMAAEKWGIPSSLIEKGIKPLYFGPNESGWDGQFYYYISNDLLGKKDTANHIDSPSYRYQRIGLPLFVASFAFLTGQSWVSPSFYYLSYLLLILLAVYAIGQIMLKQNGPVLTGSLWGLGVGTQITLLNGLPDAAADAFLILAIWSFISSRIYVAGFMLCFAALTREIYVIFPIAYFLFFISRYLHDYKNKEQYKQLIKLLIDDKVLACSFPIFIFFTWHLYILFQFKASPSSQASGILGYPFYEWSKAVTTGLSGSHYFVSPGLPSYFEGLTQLCFILLLLLTFGLTIRILINKNFFTDRIYPLAIGGLILVIVYSSFGKTVAMHYSGYMKASNIFIFLIPLFVSKCPINRTVKKIIYALLLIAVVIPSVYFWRDRVLPKTNAGYASYTKSWMVTKNSELECFNNFNVNLKLLGSEGISNAGFLSRMISSNSPQIYWIQLTNNTGNPFSSFIGKGAVNMSYHWLSMDSNKVVMDGVRSMMPGGLANSSSERIPVVVEFPKSPGNYILRFSPVQEGCSWFYLGNSESKLDLLFNIR